MAPDIFWSMTLVEWRAALAGFAERQGARTGRGPSLGRAELEALMRRFPDGNA